MADQPLIYKTRHFKELDGIRGVNLVVVLATHFGLTTIGWVAMEMFFVLSGYLITISLMGLKATQRPNILTYFLRRRVARIMPLYFLYIGVLAAVSFVAPFHKTFFSDLPQLGTFVFNYSMFPDHLTSIWYSHLWSISLEEQFYIFCGLGVFFLKVDKYRKIALALAVLAPAFRLAISSYGRSKGWGEFEVGRSVYFHSLGQLDSFLFGSCVALFGLQKSWRPALVIFVLTLAALGFGGWVNSQGDLASWYRHFGYVGAFDFGLPLFYTGNYTHVWAYSLVSLALSSFMVLIIGSPKKVFFLTKKVFKNRLLVLFGQWSYGAYILHWGFVPLFKGWFRQLSASLGAPWLREEVLQFPFYFLSVVLMGAATFYFFEQPMKRLIMGEKKWWRIEFRGSVGRSDGFKG